MIIAKKSTLKLNQLQVQKIEETFNMTTCVYNWTLMVIKDCDENHHFIPESLWLIKRFRSSSGLNGYALRFSDYLVNRAIKDALDSYQWYKVERNQHVKFKSLVTQKKWFSIGRPKTFEVSKKGIFIGGICMKDQNDQNNFLSLKEAGSVPKSKKLVGMKIASDGEKYYFKFSFETKERNLFIPKTVGIGIDVGIKTLATLSTGEVYENILHLEKVQNMLRRRKQIQSDITKLRCSSTSGQGDNAERSCRLQKLELKYEKLNKRIRNIRYDYLHKVSSEIVKRRPLFIGLESLDIRSMVGKSKTLDDRLQETALRMFLDMVAYKAELYGIPLIRLDQYFPSSKICCNCGHKKIDLLLSDRIYVCSNCGFKIDRDLNAAVNIYKAALYIYRKERCGVEVPLSAYYEHTFKSWKEPIARSIINDSTNWTNECTTDDTSDSQDNVS